MSKEGSSRAALLVANQDKASELMRFQPEAGAGLGAITLIKPGYY